MTIKIGDRVTYTNSADGTERPGILVDTYFALAFTGPRSGPNRVPGKSCTVYAVRHDDGEVRKYREPADKPGSVIAPAAAVTPDHAQGGSQ